MGMEDGRGERVSSQKCPVQGVLALTGLYLSFYLSLRNVAVAV